MLLGRFVLQLAFMPTESKTGQSSMRAAGRWQQQGPGRCGLPSCGGHCTCLDLFQIPGAFPYGREDRGTRNSTVYLARTLLIECHKSMIIATLPLEAKLSEVDANLC